MGWAIDLQLCRLGKFLARTLDIKGGKEFNRSTPVAPSCSSNLVSGYPHGTELYEVNVKFQANVMVPMKPGASCSFSNTFTGTVTIIPLM